jgi:hypothetical protein
MILVKHFHHASPRKTADSSARSNQNVAGGDNVDIDNLLVAKSHNRTFTP